jgi:hypothetical protein
LRTFCWAMCMPLLRGAVVPEPFSMTI